MNKKQLAENVMKAVKDSNLSYKILDGDEEKPKHIRIDGWGDVWPSTATFRHAGKWTRKNYSELCKKLSVVPAKSKRTETAERIERLEEICAHMERRIEDLEGLLKS